MIVHINKSTVSYEIKNGVFFQLRTPNLCVSSKDDVKLIKAIWCDLNARKIHYFYFIRISTNELNVKLKILPILGSNGTKYSRMGQVFFHKFYLVHSWVLCHKCYPSSHSHNLSGFLTPFSQYTLSLPPANIRKHYVFFMFSGGRERVQLMNKWTMNKLINWTIHFSVFIVFSGFMLVNKRILVILWSIFPDQLTELSRILKSGWLRD